MKLKTKRSFRVENEEEIEIQDNSLSDLLQETIKQTVIRSPWSKWVIAVIVIIAITVFFAIIWSSDEVREGLIDLVKQAILRKLTGN